MKRTKWEKNKYDWSCIVLLTLFLLLPRIGWAADSVIHISIDGLYANAIEVIGTDQLPGFKRLMDEGAYTLEARTDLNNTFTLPNHTSQISGRRVLESIGGHGWTANSNLLIDEDDSIHNGSSGYIETTFDVVHDNAMSTSLYASKDKFILFEQSLSATNGRQDTTGADNGRDKIDQYVYDSNTANLVSLFLSDLGSQFRHYAMLHLADPDLTGHANTWSLVENSPYLNSIKTVDGYLVQLLSFLDQTPEYDNVAIVLSSDHGGQIGWINHSPSNARSHVIPFMVWGAGVDSGDLYSFNPCSSKQPDELELPSYGSFPQPIRNLDVANTVLLLLGLGELPDAQARAVRNLTTAEQVCDDPSPYILLDQNGNPINIWL